MSPKKILFQFDVDELPSTFDAVVAIDAGVDHLVPRGGVGGITVTSLVHGAMFTRGGDDLRHTAIFIGGSDVDAAEKLYAATLKTFFGPVRVSVMLDANGCNTTAAAAVVAAGRHVDLSKTHAFVLGGTGPVGRRAAQMLASEGAQVTITSRNGSRSQAACEAVAAKVPDAKLNACEIGSPADSLADLQAAEVIIGCGAAGVELIGQSIISQLAGLKVAIDLNAVPPAGIGGVNVTDKAKSMGPTIAYGAIGVGGLKMKTHRLAIAKLFEANDLTLDAAEIYAIAKSIG
jgi:methylenetetrahydrofolate/methylenetetrahydromethanopterin dehydrogenase (NADP+)